MQNIIRNGSGPSQKGPPEFFTGTVRLDMVFKAEEPGHSTGAVVTFEPGARSHWHTHPMGQQLVILSDVGWTQCEGGPRTEVRAGDVVICGCRNDTGMVPAQRSRCHTSPSPNCSTARMSIGWSPSPTHNITRGIWSGTD